MFETTDSRNIAPGRRRSIENGSRSISTSNQALRTVPLYMGVESPLKDSRINFVCRNTQDFLKQEEIDINGLSTLSEHKIARFKYPKNISSLYLKDFKELAILKSSTYKPKKRFDNSDDCFNMEKEK